MKHYKIYFIVILQGRIIIHVILVLHILTPNINVVWVHVFILVYTVASLCNLTILNFVGVVCASGSVPERKKEKMASLLLCNTLILGSLIEYETRSFVSTKALWNVYNIVTTINAYYNRHSNDVNIDARKHMLGKQNENCKWERKNTDQRQKKWVKEETKTLSQTEI